MATLSIASLARSRYASAWGLNSGFRRGSAIARGLMRLLADRVARCLGLGVTFYLTNWSGAAGELAGFSGNLHLFALFNKEWNADFDPGLQRGWFGHVAP